MTDYRIVFTNGLSVLATAECRDTAQEIAIALAEAIQGYSTAIRSIHRLTF